MGQGATALAVGAGSAVGAGGGCLDIIFFLFSFFLSLGDGPIWTEILSQRVVYPKTTIQPNQECISVPLFFHYLH